MVRNYKRKTTRQSWSSDIMDEAAEAVMKKTMGYKRAADLYNLPRSSLQGYVKKKKCDRNYKVGKCLGKFKTVFTTNQELELVSYLKDMSKRLFGFTMKELRKLAYQLAIKNNCIHNFNKESEMAGEDWAHHFLNRHPDITLRKPEATSRESVEGDKIDVPGPSSSKRLKSNDDLENDSNDIDDSRLKVSPIKNAQKHLHSPHASKGFKDSSEFGADFLPAGGQPSENEASQKVSSDEIYIKEEDFTSSNESFQLSETPNPGIEEIDSLKMEVMDEEISDESFSLKPTSSGTSEQWSKSDEMNFAETGLVMGTNYSSTEAPVPSVPHAPPVQVSTTFIRGGRIAQNSNPTSFPPVSSSTCNLLPKPNLPTQNLPKQNLPKNSLPIEELNEPGDYGAFVNSMVTEMDLKQQVLAKFYIFKILDFGKNGKLTPMGVTL